MTTRARRRQAAKRAVRWREQAARLVAAAHYDRPQRHLAGSESYRFDMALVRAYCKRLLAEADELDMQREVFADWTRMRGMGPENRDGGAFVRTSTWCVTVNTIDEPGYWSLTVDGHTTERVWIEPISNAARDVIYVWVADMLRHRRYVRVEGNRLEVIGKRVHVDAPSPSVTIACIGQNDALRGGWPGKLAHNYAAFKRAKRKCSRRDCDGGWLLPQADERVDRVPVACPECVRAAAPTPRTFANGGNMRRAAQRLLDTLDGRCPWNDDAEAQPDECDACDGRGETGPEWPAPHGAVVSVVISPGVRVVGEDGQPREARIGEQLRVSCHACSGTGHNLRGTLPPLPEATQRKLARVVSISPQRGMSAHLPAEFTHDGVTVRFGVPRFVDAQPSPEDPT